MGAPPRLDDPFGVLRRVHAAARAAGTGRARATCAPSRSATTHSHVANIADRRLMCTCRGCYLLFTAAGGRRPADARGARRSTASSTTSRSPRQQWDDLAIPVDLVFLFRQSDAEDADGRAAARRLLPEPGRRDRVRARPRRRGSGSPRRTRRSATWPTTSQAALLRRTGPGEFTCLLVPIDACYELVGLVRKHWTGFSGGAEVWQRIDEFFDRCRTPRCAPR